MSMRSSLIYQNSITYEILMLILYGRGYWERYRIIAELIPQGSSVLDLCCGPATRFHRYLKRKAVCYTGLDINRRFV
jgi:ubiquinone/menaquinone biosynthesis C-methylase UbiE